MTRTLFLLSAAALLGLASEAAAVSGPQKKSFRALGMGNAFVAVVDDKDALYYNPAGLNLINALGNPNRRPNQSAYPRNRVDARVNVLGTALPAQDWRPFWDFYSGHKNSFKDIAVAETDSTMRGDMSNIDHRIISTVFMNSAEFAMNNYGAAYWLDAQASPYVDAGLLIPHPGIESITLDAVIMGAASRSLMRQRLSVGVGYRIVSRQELHDFKVTAGDIKDEKSKNKLIKEVRDSLMQQLFDIRDFKSWGHGIDVGVLWQQTSWLRFGAAAQNVGMYLNHKQITPELTVGLAVTPPLLSSSGVFARKVNIALDAEDLFNDDRHYKPLSKLNMGAEVEQYGWHFVSVRVAGGFKGGYWTAGTGVSVMDFVHIDAVSWAEEDGYYTGQIEDRLYAVNVGIGF